MPMDQGSARVSTKICKRLHSNETETTSNNKGLKSPSIENRNGCLEITEDDCTHIWEGQANAQMMLLRSA